MVDLKETAKAELLVVPLVAYSGQWKAVKKVTQMAAMTALLKVASMECHWVGRLAVKTEKLVSSTAAKMVNLMVVEMVG